MMAVMAIVAGVRCVRVSTVGAVGGQCVFMCRNMIHAAWSAAAVSPAVWNMPWGLSRFQTGQNCARMASISVGVSVFMWWYVLVADFGDTFKAGDGLEEVELHGSHRTVPGFDDSQPDRRARL